MNQKSLNLAHSTLVWENQNNLTILATNAVKAAKQTVTTTKAALTKAEHDEATKIGNLQDAIDDASDAEQKASQAYSEDLDNCPSVDLAEQAAGHEKLLRRALRERTELIDALFKSRQL